MCKGNDEVFNNASEGLIDTQEVINEPFGGAYFNVEEDSREEVFLEKNEKVRYKERERR